MARSSNNSKVTEVKKSFLSIDGNPFQKILGRGRSCLRELVQNDSYEDAIKKLNRKKMVIEDDEGNTPAMYAVLFGKIDLLKYINDKFGECIFLKNKKSENILHMAVKGQNLECIQYLSKKCPQLNNEVNKNYLTPLAYASLQLEGKICLELLPNCRNINQKDTCGNTVLHYAAYNSLVTLLDNLLNLKNINPYLLNKNGYSAFHEAVRNGTKEAIKIFLDKVDKSIITQLTRKDRDAVFLAVKHDRIDLCRELLKEYQIKRSTLQNGSNRGTIIHSLVLKGQLDLIINLIENDPDLLIMVNQRNQTARQLANDLSENKSYDEEKIKKFEEIEAHLKQLENKYLYYFDKKNIMKK